MNTIIIADSHTLCREALCDYIRHADPNLTVKGTGDYQSLRNHARDLSPDLIIIDRAIMQDGGMGREFNPAKIGIFLEPSEDPAGMKDFVEGIFLKSLSCKAMLDGINDILANRTFFPQIGDFTKAEFKRTFHDFNLTNREKEVMSHLVKGASNKDIARALDLQVVTVKLHVRGICRKVNAANRTQAALIAKENGWG